MVQGGLLTAHPGVVHGYGWSPGGGSSFRQGAGAASPGSPDLETAAAIQRGVHESQIYIGGFHPRAKYRRRGHRGDPPGSQEASWRVLGWGRARDPPGLLVVALLRCFGVAGSFRCADFLYIFPGIFAALLMGGKPKIQETTENNN